MRIKESTYVKPRIEKFKGDFKKVTGGCTTIPTKTIQSLKNPWHLALYVYLASKPDDWHINSTEIKNHFGVGINKVWGGLNDLISIGLMEKKERRERGKFIGCEYYLYLDLIPLNQNSGTANCE